MVTANVLIDVRRAAKFGSQNNQRVLKQTAIVQIGDQSGQSLVQCLTKLRHADKVGIVSVPAAERNLDETHAALHQTAGEQAALAEGFATIGTAQISRFLGQVKSLEVFGLHHRDRVVIHLGIGLHIAVGEGAAEVLVQFISQLHACLEFVFREAGLELDVLETVLRVVHVERAVGSREETGAWMAAVIADEDKIRQRAVAATLEHIEPGPHRRMANGAAQLVAGVHHVVSLLMSALSRGERVDHRAVMHLLRGERQVFSKADSVSAGLDGLGRSAGRRARLWIPSVQMSLATAHVEVNDILGRGDLLEL